MNKKTHEFRRKSVIVLILGMLASILLLFLFFDLSGRLCARIAYESTKSLKMDMLKETVDNFVVDIDHTREGIRAVNPGISEQEVDEMVLQYVRNRIYAEQYSDGTYMWVEKILNYEGGDEYAIRLIHPNLPDTEGTYLSTYTLNIMGNQAYLEELEGVKDKGYVFLNYAFKELNSEEITPKISYSRLYPDYDWIICMGVNETDLQQYRNQVDQEMFPLRAAIFGGALVTWVIMLSILALVTQHYTAKAYEEVQQQDVQKQQDEQDDQKQEDS